jgi:hypothetical protein
MYTFSVTFRFPHRPFSVLPAGGGGGQAETESSLALAENEYVFLPTPCFPRPNTLAYFSRSSVTKKSFVTLTPECKCWEQFIEIILLVKFYKFGVINLTKYCID